MVTTLMIFPVHQPGPVALRSPRGRFGRLRVIVLAMSILAVVASVARADSAKEYQIKAAFLYNFTKFVEWPPARFAEEAEAIEIGVLGPVAFRRELEKVVHGRKVNGRNVVVRPIGSPSEAQGCHLVFVASVEEHRLIESLRVLENAGVLTVGESDAFGTRGGMINFVREADKIRFAINQKSAERAGLKLSSQLLKLAVVVRDAD
jgi:predicted transcriptional regulator